MAHVILDGLSQEARIKALNAIQRGHVLRVSLKGSVGREQTKLRPCVVVSNDKINKAEHTLIVVPISTHGSSGKVGAHEVSLKAGDGELEENGAAQPCQVRTIDRFERVTEIWGVLSAPTMQSIEDMLGYVQTNS